MTNAPVLREDTHGVIPYAGQPEPLPALSLYSIESDLAGLLAAREDAVERGYQGPEDPEIAAEIAAIDAEIDRYFAAEVRKVNGIAGAIRFCGNNARIARDEAKRLANMADSWENRLEHIKASALRAMQAHGVKMLETPTNRLRVQGNGGLQPLEVASVDSLPPELVNVTVKMSALTWRILREAAGSYFKKLEPEVLLQEKEPSNSAIRAALKGQVACPACVGEFGKQMESGGECGICKNRGTVPATVPGARLLPRGSQLRVE